MRTNSMPVVVLAAFLGAALIGSPCQASIVKILTSVKAGTITGADADDDLNAFYLGIGANSSLVSEPISATDLDSVDVFVVMLPDDAFSGSELTAITDFVTNGGSLLLMGEQHGFAAAENVHVNAVLSALGSTMRVDSASVDAGFRDTTAGQIVLQPGITDGVSVINYGNVNTLSGVDPARRVLLTSTLTQVWGGFEPIGNGQVVLLADVNIISNLEDSIANDNHVLFANLVNIRTQNTAVKILTSTKAGTIAGADGDNDLDAFYKGKGISSSLWPGAVTTEVLEGARLLVVMLPDDAFDAGELSAMSAFLAQGGRILFMGEQQDFAATENAHINAALNALGSTMSLGALALDTSGLQDTVAGQILAHPFTTGVEVMNYGNVNAIVNVPAAGDLSGAYFLARDLESVWGAAEELLGGGVVILLADANPLSQLEDESGNDNHIFFLNLVTASTTVDVSWSSGTDNGILLHAAAPSPFRQNTRISFTLPRNEPVTLDVVDLRGRSVRRLVGASLPAGSHTVLWDGRDEGGRPAGAGVYFLTLREADSRAAGQRVVLLR